MQSILWINYKHIHIYKFVNLLIRKKKTDSFEIDEK